MMNKIIKKVVAAVNQGVIRLIKMMGEGANVIVAPEVAKIMMTTDQADDKANPLVEKDVVVNDQHGEKSNDFPIYWFSKKNLF